MPSLLPAPGAPPRITEFRNPTTAYGRIEESGNGLEIVFGNGRRAPLTFPESLERELRTGIGKNASLNGVGIVALDGLRTVEFIVHSINPRREYDPAVFAERMKRLAEVFGPIFADVDPMKFGREDDE